MLNYFIYNNNFLKKYFEIKIKIMILYYFSKKYIYH